MTKEEEKVQLHAILRGDVQGVNFRYNTRVCADRLGIVGSVRNVPDGTVEIYAQGPREKLDRLLSELEGPAGPGRVDAKDVTFSAPTLSSSGFQIVF